MVAGVDAGVGVHRVAHINGANRSSRLAVHTGDRVRSPCAESRVSLGQVYGVTTTVALALAMQSVIVVAAMLL